MSTKHTPGPWRIAKHDTLKHVRHIDAGPTGYERITIAILDGKESDANARLIAASPDLLAALKATMGVLEFFLKRDPDDDIKQAYVDAREAIAKAEG